MDRTNMRGNYSGHQPPAAARPPETSPENTQKPKHHSNSTGILRRWGKWALVIIVVIGVGFLIYGYINTKNQLDKARNPSVSGQSPTQQAIVQISKLAQLPSGETPTLATVNDASKLKSQVFFVDAKNGDKVLIYSKAGKAVLYRPSTNKIIEMSSVNLNGGTGQ